MAIKFGTSQVSNPTPAKLNLWIRVFTVVAGVFMGWMQTATFIPTKSQAIISSILGLGMALGNGLAPLFGITGLPANIPIEDVAAVDTDNKSK